VPKKKVEQAIMAETLFGRRTQRAREKHFKKTREKWRYSKQDWQRVGESG
jgi:hypothetical protein